MIPQDLFFHLPEAFYLIFFLPLFFILFFLLFLYRKNKLHAFASKINFSKIAILRSPFIYWLKTALFLLCWFFLIIALMQPEGNGSYVGENREPFALKRKAHDLYFLIDASDSMSIQSPLNKKTRLDAAKEIADEILSALSGESAALYVFTSTAAKLSPSTLDHFFVRMMLREIAINEGGVPGTDFSKALEEISKKEFQNPDKLKTLIILSDGGDTSLEGLFGNEKAKVLNRIAEKIPNPEAFNLRTFTIGIGSSEKEIVQDILYQGKPVYSGLEEDLLKLLSEKGRGKYYNSNLLTSGEIAKALLKEITPKNPYSEENEKSDPKELIVYQLFFQIPLFISLLFLSFYLFFPDTLSFVKKSSFMILLFFLPAFLPVQAALLEDALKKAQNLFEAGDEKAAISAYQELLNQQLTPFEKAVASYDLGTLFLQNNQLNEAIELLGSISLNEKAPPFLTYRTFKNLSIAKYRKALEALKEKDEASLEKAIYLLELAQKDLFKAKKASCNYQKMQGYSECQDKPDLIRLENAVVFWLKKTSKTLGKPIQDPNSSDLFLKRIEELEQKTLKKKPKDIKELQNLLKLAIEMEHEVLLKTRAVNQMEEENEQSLDILKMAQNKTLQVADLYLKNSLAIQEREYEKTGCQKKPWNKILPFYHKGYDAALKALSLMPTDKEASILSQEEAMKYWREAIKKSEDKKQEKQLEESSENQPEKTSDKSEKALQLLQEMHTHDKKQKAYQQPFKQEIERPW